jgi:quercetin dioxygenase-like cupin family protein
MESPEMVQHLLERAAFRAAVMTKIDCFRSHRLLVGLNCFEPGQSQAMHTHADADKFYLVLEGKATFVVAEQEIEAGPTDLIVAPAGIPHGVARAHERSVVLVAMAPAPKSEGKREERGARGARGEREGGGDGTSRR